MIATRQLEPIQSDEWLRVKEAGRVTGEGLRTWQRRAEWECKLARQQGRMALCRKAVPAERGRSVWFVHRSFDRRLTAFPKSNEREDRARTALKLKYAEHKVN
jgi:hypothetical protein